MTHTREEILAMTDEELNKAIAEAKGWTYISPLLCGYPPDTKTPPEEQVPWEFPARANGVRKITDYARDIAAAWELEGEIPFGDRHRYIEILVVLLDAIHQPRRQWEQEWLLAHSLPVEKSRAWLMWKEGV